MACGKPPDPDHMTPPEGGGHPAKGLVESCLRDIEQSINRAPGAKSIDAELKRAARIIVRAEQAGANQAQIAELQDRLHKLEQQGVARVNHLAAGIHRPSSASTQSPGPSAASISATRAMPIVREALANPHHSLHERITAQVTGFVRGNQQISEAYKKQLGKDIAEVVRVTPTALGLVKAAIQRGQPTPLASASKLGRGTGYVYEIMGTAALIRQPSQAVNKGGRPLSIQAGADKVHHGIRTTRELPQKKGSTEADIWIQKPDGTDVAVDFKHAQNNGSYSDKAGRAATESGTSPLGKQLEAVANDLKSGVYHEFHFATNGHFSTGFKQAVEEANQSLAKDGHTPISLHENVIAAELRAS